MFESLHRLTTETLLQVLKFTVEDSVQYHHTVTERDKDIQDQFSQYSDRMADIEAKMNQWATKVCILQALECPGFSGSVLQFSDMEHCLGYTEDRALHAETIADKALGTIRSYVDSSNKVRVVHLGV